MSPEGNKICPTEGTLATTSPLDRPSRIITGPLLASNLIAKDEGLLLGLEPSGVFFLDRQHPGAGFLMLCTLWSPLVLFAISGSLLPELGRTVSPDPL